MSINRAFDRFAAFAAKACGSVWAFALAVGSIIVWAGTGPWFSYSESWQMIINTGTTIVTFIMVFVIQSAQNREGAALSLKIDELIRASSAKNIFIGIEDLSVDELKSLRAKLLSDS